MIAIKPVCLAPILLLSPQRIEQSGYGATLSAEQMSQHMLSQFFLVLPLGSQSGLFEDNLQDVVG
ncbi:hypothetical protein LCGC14_2920860 [marine sediment metagenome]|jgi:hypothetical protein|uniref:Uncharacterized protein n=1 Tax=marine sediment metagenome TaxID=412755 RepID=A0A0F8ZWE2_9ZZZZ